MNEMTGGSIKNYKKKLLICRWPTFLQECGEMRREKKRELGRGAVSPSNEAVCLLEHTSTHGCLGSHVIMFHHD